MEIFKHRMSSTVARFLLLLLLPAMALGRPQFFIPFDANGRGFLPFKHSPFFQPAAIPSVPASAWSTPAATTVKSTRQSSSTLIASSTVQHASVTSGTAGEQPLELTPRYNTFPWSFGTERIYMLFMVPPAQAPTPSPAYTLPPLKNFVGGQSYLALITYTDSAIGYYHELMYISGAYADPAACSSSPVASIDRIWVDSKLSQRAGRNIWGIPKELATFEWDSQPGHESVVVKDAVTGNLILQATFSDFPALPGFIFNTAYNIAKNILPIPSDGVQGPVTDPVTDAANQVDPATVPAYATSRAAFNSTKLLKSKIEFNTDGSQVKKVTSWVASSEALLGRPGVKLSPLLPLAVKIPSGARSSISAPVIIDC